MAKLTPRQREDLVIDALKLDEKGKKLYTQQVLADKYKVSKTIVNRYIKSKVDKSKQLIPDEIECLVNLEKIRKEKSEHFTIHEAQEVNNYIQRTVTAIMHIDKCISENQQLADTLQQQLRLNINKELEALEDGTLLKPEAIMNALLIVDGFSKVSTRNRMALLPKEFAPDSLDDKGKKKDKKWTIEIVKPKEDVK